ARLLNGLGTGIIFAGKTEHGAGHAKSSGPRDLGKLVALIPGRMMRITAGNLDDINSELVHKPFQLGNALHLQRPAANADSKGFNGHGGIPFGMSRLSRAKISSSLFL